MGAVRTRRKAVLGSRMKAIREASPLKPLPAQVAEFVRVTTTTITRMEAGMSAPQWAQVLACLTLYEATEDQIREVLALWEAARRPMTTVENAAELHPNYVAFRRDEADASKVLSMHYSALSGQFQTAETAAAIFTSIADEPRTEAAEIRAAKDRKARQQLLEPPNALEVHAILDEALLHREVGGPKVLEGQLAHLLDLSQRPNVTIQVVPFSAGAWGTMSGPVIILQFGSDEYPDLAYLEHAGGGASVENLPAVKKLVDIHKAVADHKAATPKESAGLITAALDAVRKK
jgi:hypothetical protein